MTIADVTARQKEVLRQVRLLRRDTVLRLPVLAVVQLICAQFVGWSVAGLATALFLAAEWKQAQVGLRYHDEPSRANYLHLIVYSTIASTAVLLPVVSLWDTGDFYPRLICVIVLMGAFLHVILVRTPHLPFAIFTALPIALAFYWLIVLHYLEDPDPMILAISLAGVTVLNTYFFFAVVSHNRVQRALIAARDRAATASAMKSRFLATMSHELRTPLNAILGVSQLLREQPDHPSNPTRVAAMEQAARSLKMLVDEVLDLSRIEQGHVTMENRAADLVAEVGAVCELHRPLAVARGLAFSITYAEDVSRHLSFDPLRMRQCLTNLLNNALKVTERGGIRVCVSTRALSNSEFLVSIMVSDTGPGIAPQERDRLFRDGGMASGRTTTTTGAGLGLSISRTLARRMGGDISLLPSDGPGASFLLTFRTEAARTEQVAPTTCATIAPATILVVDDIATNRMVTSAFLRAAGHEVHEVGSGTDALVDLGSAAIDLVLLDMNMPGLSGMETFAAIRALSPPERDIPVVALTADAMAGDRERYLAAGLDGYLPKPVDRMDLLTEVARALRVRAFVMEGHTSRAG